LPLVLESETGRRSFRAALLRWFDAHARALPWRGTRDPYRVWISEIMLQQTRVAAVLARYGEFLRRFPDVESLAAARLAEVLAAWSGLGYYRRARSLHQAARAIVEGGVGFPQTSAAWRELPGIGRYTAAAIASITFGEPRAVLDGNVERVLRRLLARHDGSSTALWESAEQLLVRRRPGDFNQAMMELGATVCLPQQPRCPECPVTRWCKTRGVLPARPQPPRRTRNIACLLARRGPSVCLVQRAASQSLMPGMWELPEIAAPSSAPLFSLRHAITVTDYHVDVYTGQRPPRIAGARWFCPDQLPGLPLTGLARKILRRAGLI
jgi:A/G-specific adenine glycosylase